MGNAVPTSLLYKQAALWVSLLLVLAIIVAVCATANMNDGEKDSLLYAKFITS